MKKKDGERLIEAPDSYLLSHGSEPHYHRRGDISLLCSEWEQVVLPRYLRQANWLTISKLRVHSHKAPVS